MSYYYGCNYPPMACPPRPYPPTPITTGPSVLRTTNLAPQLGTTTAGLINLGYAEYTRGRDISLYQPYTINITAGLYYVEIAGDFVSTDIGDTLTIQPLFNGNPIVGSSLIVAFDQLSTTFSANNHFFISAERAGILTFQQLASDVDDTIVDFTVTMIRV